MPDYTIKRSPPPEHLFTVGYTADGEWMPLSDHNSYAEAHAALEARLNPNDGLYARIAHLERQLDAAGALPKIVIDHLKYGTGAAPFDGNGYLLHDRSGGIVSGSYMIDHDIGDDHIWRDDAGFTYKAGNFTHYTPKPKFFEVRTLETKA